MSSAEPLRSCLPPNALNSTKSKMVASDQSNLETVVGLHVNGPNGAEIVIGPSPDSAWKLGERDRIIVLAQKVYA